MSLGDLTTQIALHDGELSAVQQKQLLQQTDADLARLSLASVLLLSLGMIWSWRVLEFPADERSLINALMGVFFLGVLLRVFAFISLKKSFYHIYPVRWRKFFFSGVVLTAATWGLFVGVLIVQFGFGWQSWIYMMASAGVGVGGALNFCMWKKLAVFHVLLVFSPLLLVYLWLGGDPGYSALLAGGLYLLLLFVHINYWNRRYWDSLIHVQLLKNIGDELEASNLRLYTSATTDALTGLANRVRLDEQFDSLHALYQRHETLYSVVMVDLDHFKRINDRFGHHVGDEVLCFAAHQFKKGMRTSDLVGRWGGEEFLLLLPESGAEGAYRLAESLRLKLCKNSHSAAGVVTASFGVSVVQPEDSIDDLLKRADRALYLAKQSGRNRVCLAGEHSLPEGD
ncbi:MAG: GGDEF domain-containing protein, partial [Gammaproteobacteria bacterium]|nr:GGDEF domain-containing protein [Gammaproteobacteria bacterium]